jgi:hypothetical protein
MPLGEQNGTLLQFLRVFARPRKRAGTRWSAELHIWVADAHILEVDQALQTLKAVQPEASISQLVVSSIIAAARKAKRARPKE